MLGCRELQVERGLLGEVSDAGQEILILTWWIVEYEGFTDSRRSESDEEP
jgi:hypothetical protein